jgi:hypothetical protein
VLPVTRTTSRDSGNPAFSGQSIQIVSSKKSRNHPWWWLFIILNDGKNGYLWTFLTSIGQEAGYSRRPPTPPYIGSVYGGSRGVLKAVKLLLSGEQPQFP